MNFLDYETADKEHQGCLNECSNFQIIKLERKNFKVAWKPLVSLYVILGNFVIGHTAPQLWVVWWLVKSYSWRSRAILERYFKKQKLEWMMWLGSVCSQRYNSGCRVLTFLRKKSKVKSIGLINAAIARKEAVVAPRSALRPSPHEYKVITWLDAKREQQLV